MRRHSGIKTARPNFRLYHAVKVVLAALASTTGAPAWAGAPFDLACIPDGRSGRPMTSRQSAWKRILCDLATNDAHLQRDDSLPPRARGIPRSAQHSGKSRPVHDRGLRRSSCGGNVLRRLPKSEKSAARPAPRHDWHGNRCACPPAGSLPDRNPGISQRNRMRPQSPERRPCAVERRLAAHPVVARSVPHRGNRPSRSCDPGPNDNRPNGRGILLL